MVDGWISRFAEKQRPAPNQGLVLAHLRSWTGAAELLEAVA